MSNYGTNFGKGSTISGDANISNKTIIKKGKTVTYIAVAVVLVIIIALFATKKNKVDITGRWLTEEGGSIEFLSDGTFHEDGYDSLYADTYEIMDEGYLKWGRYDASWIDYRYSYWDLELKGKNMTLTSRANPDYSMQLFRE